MPPSPQILLTPAQLGALLMAARKAGKMSQTVLAGRLGLSQSRISHLESNAGQLSVAQLLAWCAALGLELALGQCGGQTQVDDMGRAGRPWSAPVARNPHPHQPHRQRGQQAQ